jgi:hypothetical protein
VGRRQATGPHIDALRTPPTSVELALDMFDLGLERVSLRREAALSLGTQKDSSRSVVVRQAGQLLSRTCSRSRL